VATCHAMDGHGWTHVMLWVDMGGHRSMLMVMVVGLWCKAALSYG
jgi:hypothetical protein